MKEKSALSRALLTKCKDKKGALLWELMLALAILFIFLYCCVTLLGVFVQFENFSLAAKRIAREVEISGEYNDGVSDSLASTFLDSEYFTDVDVTCSSEGKIQLKETFTVTVTATCQYTLVGFNGGLWGSFHFDIPMSYSVQGMSEVYHKN